MIIMAKVIADISMSLDGYTAGLHATTTNPMGDGGNQLHEWLFAGRTAVDASLMDEMVAGAGAVITGANTYFGAIDGAWEGVSPFNIPVFVVSHRKPQVRVPGFTFAEGGITGALSEAKLHAGNKNIWIMGGASITRQYLEGGLADEIRIHIAPVLLGAGTRLFGEMKAGYPPLEKIAAVNTACATHLYFRVIK